MDAPCQPNWTGFVALSEPDQVDWSQLEHAYGKSAVSLGPGAGFPTNIDGDVVRSLAALRTDPGQAFNALYSNICHQGTVYQATAHAVPFIAAVAAGDVPDGIRTPLLALLGGIAIGGSYVAPNGYHSRAFGEGVDVLVTESLAASVEGLATIRSPRLVALIHPIRLLLEEPTDARRAAVESAVDLAVAPLPTLGDL
ncbi:hypothetical protein J7I84_18980 [Arthrobacter sp. ISL-85]|uniref:hypothetical protein n=1 Tax=Arthrobacter sp. ISL-85 TaxID=2819115 RepID=UPI001BEB4759|nr:hypothetical protein [Arthrobacter sp. ISL-85]MBT2568541.1 hypothetical protein [Arthrobacter sp. ISL-85]